ncbi:hypothetical protein Catovirus_2_237 [Catovirus CTV1]|uniref:Uncharacterized protein n=1 Tax=Catovirus CTV1 TaxID=1977631 RepID=A0A1V0SCA4_9VIRU|nr:hypothetical protein Catovirus_2_237 [Catovirus CTV1]
MDFFSGSVPNLISNRSIKNMENMIKKVNPVKETSILDIFGSFYVNYIEPNMFVIIMFIILTLFLIYKYYTKEEPDIKKEMDITMDNMIDNEELSIESSPDPFNL